MDSSSSSSQWARSERDTGSLQIDSHWFTIRCISTAGKRSRSTPHHVMQILPVLLFHSPRHYNRNWVSWSAARSLSRSSHFTGRSGWDFPPLTNSSPLPSTLPSHTGATSYGIPPINRSPVTVSNLFNYAGLWVFVIVRSAGGLWPTRQQQQQKSFLTMTNDWLAGWPGGSSVPNREQFE